MRSVQRGSQKTIDVQNTDLLREAIDEELKIISAEEKMENNERKVNQIEFKETKVQKTKTKSSKSLVSNADGSGKGEHTPIDHLQKKLYMKEVSEVKEDLEKPMIPLTQITHKVESSINPVISPTRQDEEEEQQTPRKDPSENRQSSSGKPASKNTLDRLIDQAENEPKVTESQII